MNATHTAIAASLLLAAATAHAGPVSVDPSCNPRITQLEARLVQKAAQGPDVFRNFVVMRRDIWQLDVRESADKMEQLRALGVQISVDDFGAGYSSLSYLQRLPIDILKLDRSFMEDVKPEGVSSSSLVQGIVALAHGLGIRVTAEGVETQQQLDLVHHSGCDKVQGFLLGRPSPAANALSTQNGSRTPALQKP